MTTLLLTIVIFLEILEYIVIFDIILSWLILLWIRFRPKFIHEILNPLYKIVQKYIPTRFWAFDFTPIIIILLLAFVRGFIIMSAPEVWIQLAQLLSK